MGDGINVFDRNAGFAAGQEQVWGFGKDTGIDSKSYLAPGAKIFYVDPNNTQATDTGNLGEDPTVPLATIQYAVTNLVRDHMGDTIVVGASDAWQYAPVTNRPTQITESVVIPSDKGGLRIVGAAPDPLGVPWSPAADNGVALSIFAIDVLVEGFNFYTGLYSNCIGILARWDSTDDEYGENITVRNCFFDSSLDYGIQMDYSWFNQIYNNYFDEIAVAAIHSLDVEGDPDYCCIVNNRFMDCTAAIDLEDTDYCFIHGNLIYGDGTGAANFIDLNAGASGMVSDNWLSCTLAQYPVTCLDGGGTYIWVNNHCIDGDTVANA